MTLVDSTGRTMLHFLAYSDIDGADAAVIINDLDRNLINVGTNSGTTPLMLACKIGNAATV